MHSNVLDSRSIGLGDAFGQRFMKEGTYHYNVLRPGGGRMSDEFPYEITVNRSESGREMHQETVLVGSQERGLYPDRRQIEIHAGDLVIWAPANSAVTRFEVAGDKDFFGSATLTNECGYSHAFGLVGEYHWRDAYGGKARGVVRVKEPKVDTPTDIERWKRKLANAQLVMISDGKVEPAEVDIEMGQTVYFAVVNGDGISVTDEQLLRAGGHDIDGPPQVAEAEKRKPEKPTESAARKKRKPKKPTESGARKK